MSINVPMWLRPTLVGNASRCEICACICTHGLNHLLERCGLVSHLLDCCGIWRSYDGVRSPGLGAEGLVDKAFLLYETLAGDLGHALVSLGIYGTFERIDQAHGLRVSQLHDHGRG